MFDIPRGEKLPQDLERLFSNLRSARQRSSIFDAVELRASSFPVCPRAYHIFRRTPIRKRPVKEAAFVAESTALMGTALHLSLQRWFSLNGSLYGNWVCVHCKKIRRHSLGIQHCQSCGRLMLYHEYAIEPDDEIPFSGHIDSILVRGKEPLLVDFKGSSQDAIRKIKDSGRPKESHYLQVNAYANAVNLRQQQFGNVGIISNVIIIYVDRGQPHRLWHAIQVPVRVDLFNEMVGRIRLAQSSLKDLIIPRGLCSSQVDEYARYCPWKTTCFSPAIEGLLSSTVEPEAGKREKPEQESLLLASYLDSS